MATQDTPSTPVTGTPDTRVVGRRVVGFVVDIALGSAVGWLVAELLDLAFFSPVYGGTAPAGRILQVVFAVAIWLALLVVVPTVRGGRTLGMTLVGVRVVRAADGTEPGAAQHLVRFLLLVVDGLVSGLVGLLVVLGSAQQRRVGDMAAATLVVRDHR